MYNFNDLARAYDGVLSNGTIKSVNEDFVVEEIMPIQPSGEGGHLWVQIKKSGCNTEWLARQLVRIAEVKPVAVSYAGLKDRHAVTTQWFSIHLPGQPDPDLSALQSDEFQILQAIRHDRKLKRGALSGNHFKLRIRNSSATADQLEQRIALIAQQGVPNYFGEQRFGHGMANLDKAEELFRGGLRKLKKHQRGIYLSAARSWIFNQVLSERIRQENWNRYIKGDVFMLEGKTACFADDNSDDIGTRIEHKEIHPTGPLWGRGKNMAQQDCLLLENNIAAQYELLCQGLEKAGMQQERRSLRLMVNQLNWQLESNDTFVLEFDLPAGAYATMVLREIIQLTAEPLD